VRPPVSIRAASADDVARIIEIVNSEPGEDAVALMGSLELAQRYRARMIELEEIPNPSRPTVVAEIADRVVGVLQYRLDDEGRHGKLAHLRVLASLVGPTGLVRRAPALWARTRVPLSIPPDSFFLTNLHIDAERRGQGVGGRLLDWAEQEARGRGVPLMALTTIAKGRPIALYERHGFSITQTATHPSYERSFNVPGRVLMEKQLRL
jgi:GNAT superfamily N-acetyltransferase